MTLRAIAAPATMSVCSSGCVAAILAGTVGVSSLGMWCVPVLAAEIDPSIVVVLKSSDLDPYDEALAGLRSYLDSKTDDRPAWVIEYQAAGDVEQARRMMLGILRKSPSVVVTLGSVATEAAVVTTKEVPIVFAMVLNPVASGLVTEIGSTGRNLTGVAMDIPIRYQFEAIQMICGKKVRRIGVLYNEDETGQVVQEARTVAEGMNLEIVAERIDRGADIPGAVDRIVHNADVLWMVADGRVYTEATTEFVILETLRWRLPLFGISRPYVEAGALMALTCDYEGLGRQAGRLVARILDGAPPGELPIEGPQVVHHVINPRTASKIGVEIPPDLLRRAQKVAP
jgi:putative ABC transport system substrate-binding protein